MTEIPVIGHIYGVYINDYPPDWYFTTAKAAREFCRYMNKRRESSFPTQEYFYEEFEIFDFSNEDFNENTN